MTYFDLLPAERELYHAIHGGPRPRAGRLRAYLRSRGVRVPCQVLALYLSGKAHADLQRSKLRSACLLRIHPAMGYLLLSGGADRAERLLRGRRVLFGERHAVKQPAALVAAIQSAIVSLRSRQLAPLAQRLGPLAFEDEVGARLEAEQAVRGAAREWRSKLKHWCQIVLVRHYRQLNTIRRKLVEFLALLTRDLSEGFGLDYPFALAIQELYATFAVTDWAARFPELVATLVPMLAQRRLEHLETVARRAALSEPVRKALEVMRAHFAEPVGLAEIAAAVHTSAPHLSRLFRRETGRTLTEHLQSLRVACAQKRLAESGAGILEIARASGFPTLEHFYRTFKRRVGLTPRAYRRSQRA
ncbi:MAG: helix-turn-helix transcriptional regulator [Planctomycetes bacterium]|nr:helix-turn-helix transcriptional regulator [Planctomycetota bacterium]